MKIKIFWFLTQYTLQVISVLLMTKIAFNMHTDIRVYWLATLAALPFLGLVELGSNNMNAKLFREQIRGGNIKLIYQVIFTSLMISSIVSLLVIYGFLLIDENTWLAHFHSNVKFSIILAISLTIKSLGGILNNIIYATGDYLYDKLCRIASSILGIVILLIIVNVETRNGVSITWAVQGLASIIFFVIYNKKQQYKIKNIPTKTFHGVRTFLIVAIPGTLLTTAPQIILNHKVGPTDFQNYVSIMSILYGLQGLTTVFGNINGAEMMRGTVSYTKSIQLTAYRTFVLSVIFLILFFLLNPIY